jgi:hypothetical protein
MFKNEKLQEYLETSSSIKTQPAVIAEWNLNFAENISTIGNYRYRPTASPESEDAVFSLLPNSFDINDAENEIQFYTGATDADVVVDGGLDNNDQPIAFVLPNEKERLLYSLEDCFYRFRPRSGINKLRYFENNYTHHTNPLMANRPRYYMPTRDDSFKYWTSYRLEDGVERGIANKIVGAQYFIDDTSPFVVYKEEIPANRIVVKMQTHVGSEDLGPFSNEVEVFDDPFFGENNQATPTNWKIQCLRENDWIDAFVFDPLTVRKDNSPAIGPDGYIEIAYGVVVPEEYEDVFSFVGYYSSETLLPNSPTLGSAYLVGASSQEVGTMFVWDGNEYISFVPEYGWMLSEEDVSSKTNLITQVVNPDSFVNPSTGETQYREFSYLRGIRIVVETMNKQNSTFDLIEISPRLAVDLTEKVSQFSVNKSASDLGVSGMPVGQLLASTGSLSLFDYDEAFTYNNPNSILAKYLKINVQIKLYDVVYALESFEESIQQSTFYVPIKFMYVDSFPEINSVNRNVELELRDLFFYFEDLDAPQILVENASLSYAVSLLLDSIGFANYAFLRVSEEDDPIIPYFFVAPEKTVAEVLQSLALSTQSAMFFDEYNNFIVMSKNYIMPKEDERPTDIVLSGSGDQEKSGVLENSSTKNKLANIIEMSSSENKIYNDGSISYTTRYIQKTYGSLKQASLIDKDKTWIYRPVLLWEAGGEELVRSRDEDSTSSSFSLSAIPLNSDLTDQVPFVINNEMQGNIIDFGEGVYWLGRYSGYFYANGEIIRFDAVEYNVSGLGDVWISSVKEYQNYFSKILFNGKIYPTGRVKIYAEPDFEEIEGITVMANGEVAKHGRGQFGTPVVGHTAGLSPYWSDTSNNAPVGGVEMDSSYLFGQNADLRLSSVFNEGTNRGRVLALIEEEEKINSIAFGDGVWAGAGNSGKFRISDDGLDWQTVSDLDLDPTFVFNSIAYGLDDDQNGIWVAVGTRTGEFGQEAAIVTSPDRINWTIRSNDFYSTNINRIKYVNNLWVAVGQASEFRSSTDLINWTTHVPNFDRFPKAITEIGQLDAKNLTSISQGAPAIFNLNNHGLRDDDKIKLFTTGTLPDGLITGQVYYAQVLDANRFTVSLEPGGISATASSAGSGTHSFREQAAILTAIAHGMSDNNVFHIATSSDLPDDIESYKIYYARKIDANRVAFSEDADGELIDFSTPVSGVAYQMNRFGEADINSVDFGNNTWVVVAKNGQISRSADLFSWTTFDSGFGSSSINDLIFANNLWIAVASEGKIRTSTDASTWTSRTSNFGASAINSVAFGNALFVAAGNDSKVSTSSDGTTWTARSTGFAANIFEIDYGNRWIIVGDRLQVKTSDNAISWQDQTNDNAGEVVFQTLSPHNLTPLDYVRFFTNGSLPTDKPKEQKAFNSISIGSPAIFTRVGHDLANGEEIRLFTTGVLPAGLSTETSYYVRDVGATASPSFLVANTFHVSLTPGGPPVNTTAEPPQSGVHSFSRFWVTGMIEDRRYYVTPAKLSPNTFTIAETREDARIGKPLTAGGSQSGEHSLVLDIVPDIQNISGFLNNSGQLAIQTESSNDLQPGDRIFFGTRKGFDFVSKQLPNGLIRYTAYWIKNRLSENSFTVSTSLDGESLPYRDLPVSLSAGESFCVILNITEEILFSNVFVPNTTSLKVGSTVESVSGPAELESSTRISAIRTSQRVNTVIDSIQQGSPALFVSANHKLFSGDLVRLSTSGTLPVGVEANRNYFVEKVDNNSFHLFYALGFDPVVAFNEEQSGIHTVSKDLNYKDSVTLSPIPLISFAKTVEPFFSNETEIGSDPTNIVSQNRMRVLDQPLVSNSGKAGVSLENKDLARSASRNGIIKNFLSSSSFSETEVNRFYATQAGTIQSSAMIMSGPSFSSEIDDQEKRPIDFVSYVYKELDNRFTHFGTRVRIIGRLENEERIQNAFNSINYYQTLNEDPSDLFSLSGASAGLAVMLNPETNMGYYFEIVALTESNVEDFGGADGLYNVLFYKITRKVANEGEPSVEDEAPAIPVRLWGGATSVVVDDGTLVGQFRMVNEQNPSVYDLAVEYEDIDTNTRRFYLYFNNRVIAVVDDSSPLPVYNNIAMFVRGEARAMFENIYAIANNYSQNTVSVLDTPINSVFGTESVNVSESFRKYSMSGLVQSTYLSGIGTNDTPQYNIYFDEFGTIMREAAYFNIRYDKAYPALYAQISPTFNKMKSYTVSGFVPHAYGAEFLIFNHTDAAISLDETSGNYLRIQGVTFTQESEKELTVDDYFENISNFSNPTFKEDGLIRSPVKAKRAYQDIKNSRITNGVSQFNLSSPYIQSQDDASEMIGWLLEKTSKPRRAIGLNVFGLPTLQLGDIVKVDYVSKEGTEQVSLKNSRFVVYNIEYKRNAGGPAMNVFLSEVL